MPPLVPRLAYRPYRSNLTLTFALSALLAGQLAWSLLVLRSLGTAARGLELAPASLGELLRPGLGRQAMVFLATAACFLAWLHRAHANLPALGAATPGLTPAKAVWGWFIPLYNLLHGFRSVYVLHDLGRLRHGVPRSTAPLLSWWAVFLSCYGTPFDASRFGLAAHHALHALASLLCLIVVVQIEQRQRERHADFEHLRQLRPLTVGGVTAPIVFPAR